MKTITVEQLHRMLKLVADSPAQLDLDVLAHLLDRAVNGDPDQRENAIAAILSILDAKPTIN